MQVIKVDEEKERPAGIPFQPPGGSVHDVCPQAFDIARVSGFLSMQVEGAVVVIKTLVQSETAIEDETAHDGARVISARFQDGSERYDFGTERFTVVLNPIEKRIRGGEQRNMRWERQGDG